MTGFGRLTKVESFSVAPDFSIDHELRFSCDQVNAQLDGPWCFNPLVVCRSPMGVVVS